MIYLFAPLLAAAADPDNSARMLLDGTPVAGCGGFADLEVNLFAFDRYPDYFDENSSFTLYPAGSREQFKSTSSSRRPSRLSSSR